MSVPPSGRRPSSTPSHKGRPEDASDKDNGREFKLPAKNQHLEGKEEDPESKKKGLFDIAGKEAALQDKQQNLSSDLKAQSIKTEAVTGSEAVAEVNKMSELVQKMVETMRIGQVDGKNFASLDLKQGADVPKAFAGSQLTLSYEENGLSIHFDHFMSPQQQNTAINLVEKNKEQLELMVQALSAKNIQVTEITLGTHSIAIPRVAPLPPPFQTPPAAQTETGQQRREQEGRQEERGEPEGGLR